jgi:hypothetical protein
MEVWHTARHAGPVTLNRSTEPVSATVFITLVDSCSSNQGILRNMRKVEFVKFISILIRALHWTRIWSILKLSEHISGLQTPNIHVTLVTKTEISYNTRKSVLLMQK